MFPDLLQIVEESFRDRDLVRSGIEFSGVVRPQIAQLRLAEFSGSIESLVKRQSQRLFVDDLSVKDQMQQRLYSHRLDQSSLGLGEGMSDDNALLWEITRIRRSLFDELHQIHERIGLSEETIDLFGSWNHHLLWLLRHLDARNAVDRDEFEDTAQSRLALTGD